MNDQQHHSEILFMQRAFELALRGRGYASPNPLVGCVIVHEGSIIGEGWHRKYGDAHAEVNAVNAVHHKSKLRESTVFVNLEPCSHFGKTPPCADLLIQHQVKRVVIANIDSNPLVGGKGIQKLRDAGIEVQTGVLEKEGRELNARFFTFVEKKRPYVILKWAQTSDGFIARENFDSKWISGELSRKLVHRWRGEEAAILVGKNTALHDNPRLNVRSWTGPDPIRIVVDKKLELPKELSIYDGSQRTLIYNSVKDQLNENGVALVKVDDTHFINSLLTDLHSKSIQSIIIEGGAHTLQQFIDLGLWDEARVFVSPKEFARGITAPRFAGDIVTQQKIEDDILKIYTNR